MCEFIKFALIPAGLRDAALAIAACRAGGVGVVNAELSSNTERIRDELNAVADRVRTPYGLKLGALDNALGTVLLAHAARGLRWLMVDAEQVPDDRALIDRLRAAGVKVLAELKTPLWPGAPLESAVDGLILKGNEAGGFVGEDASFILLQRWRGRTRLPLYVRGGLTPHTAAACSAVGVAGGVLDSQLLLLPEVRLPESVRALLGNLSGSETVAVGDSERGEYFRLLVRPGHTAARQFQIDGEGQDFSALTPLVQGKTDWDQPATSLLPIGQDVAFAAAWGTRYRSLGALFKAFDTAIAGHLRLAAELRPVSESAPFATALGLRYPLVQGPMTRVSDTAEFALAVAEGGGLPMVALALLKGDPLDTLLAQTSTLLGDRHWGIGLLGFAPQALLDEQLAIAIKYKPDYAIIAGGRPDQAIHLAKAGVPTFLHVPAPSLIPLFLQEGARRFIFEGRECGGHVGPLSSFVLWSAMVEQLLADLAPGKIDGGEIELLFAGGIHDAVSSAMVQVLAAPLAAKGVKVGILMGSAYLFTREIVASGSIVPQFQEEVIACERTINLESGPGHASRCAFTPFAQEFLRKRVELRDKKVPADEARQALDLLILGRLRVASKGRGRDGPNGALQALDTEHQRREGMYMLGQVATLRAEVTDIQTLHRQVTYDALDLLCERLVETQAPELAVGHPADIAIVGMAGVLPKAASAREYWDNILAKVDAITEIPKHRWDWRLYFAEDRQAKDKIYSKWGGFLDDMMFDPTRYGIPPKTIESVDPMQLMALEVAQRTLVDAGYHDREFDRERAAVIIGASGGAGDVGTQYGLRAEWPRFNGELPERVADRLPEWTEDTFGGLLVNVIAGRIANRLNFGGVNFTTDAACASSLASIYQGVCELVAGRSDFVIAGGVDTTQGPFGYLCFSKTQALSPRGRCSTFDVSGDGIVISEGIAMVALKRLGDAERDGDRIYAVIKGVGGSSDGNAKGLTAPVPAGQLRAMRRAYAQAGFGPRDVSLFEAHGTGTVAGDTAELDSTTRLISEGGGGAHQAAIGSVKTMIGHTKAAAGICGLIKAAFALHHRTLPPHFGVTQPNAALQSADSPLYLVEEAQPWIASPDGAPRRAAVSAFGFGGANFHVALEEYAGEYRDWLREAPMQRWPAELFVWSAPDRDALAARVADSQTQLEGAADVAMSDVAATLAAHWQPAGETLAIVAKDVADLCAKLKAAASYLRGEATILPPGVSHGTSERAPGKVALLFPGQGSQYPGMLREVALHFPVCAAALADADRLSLDAFEARFGAHVRLSHFILPRGAYDDEAKGEARRALTSTDVAQPALGAVEVALLRLLRDLGVRGDMAAGHSYGEFVALHAGGVIDFDALIALSAARGRFIVDAARAAGSELGTMVAVAAPRERIEAAIAGIDGVIVANHNAPAQAVISGAHAAVKAASERLQAIGIEVSPLPVAAAFHSHLVKPAQHPLQQVIDATPWQPASIPVYSNTTAMPHPGDAAASKQLMAEHLVRPVEFVAEIEAMYRDGARVFVEVGPKAVLTGIAAQILQGRAHTAVALDNGAGLRGFLSALGQLLCAGVAVDVGRLFVGRGCRVGDPAQLRSLQPDKTVPKTAWMLNGSGARRAADPVRQVGVTLEDMREAEAERRAAAPVAKPPSAVLARPTTVNLRRQQPLEEASGTGTLSDGRWRKEHKMQDGSSGPNPADAVLAEYFATMREFLQTQERVITAYMGGPLAAARTGARIARSAAPMMIPHTPKPEAMHAPAPVPAAKPAAAIEVPASVAAAALKAVPTGESPVRMNGSAKHKEAAAIGAPLGRDTLADMLLKIVEEKTGYPREMVGLDQDLESDLGIDSIKRIEVIGAMLQALPERHRAQLSESRSKLNTQPTINRMLDILAAPPARAEETARPFDLAETGARASQSHPSRHVVCAHPDPIDADAQLRLTCGHFLITEDRLGLAVEMAARLVARGRPASLVPRDALADEAALDAWIEEERPKHGAIAGIVHLAQLGADWIAPDASTSAWRRQLQVGEKSLFLLLRGFSDRLADEAHVLSASALGGYFNRQGSVGVGLSLQGGTVGLLKSYAEERPGVRVKAVDVDPRETPAHIADALLAELQFADGRVEIGYPGGRRTAFHTAEAPLDADSARPQDLRGIVVLATGGARGITAETLRELALPGNILVLTGRSALPAAETPEEAGLDAVALRQRFIADVRDGRSHLKPVEIERKVKEVLAAREMRANLDDFRRAGAAVEYHAVDVTCEDEMRALVDGVYERLERIDCVVHGAGVIEDRLLADKSSESWSRVVETKALGLLMLQRFLRPATLRHFVVYSSVAGRFGNRGQCDYAAANELMNRLCCQLRDHWQGRVRVRAMCWGPWAATKFGPGMVTPETEAKFAEKGVRLVSAALGRALFRDELLRADTSPVEIICGEGAWEQHEAPRDLRAPPPPATRDAIAGPLLGAAKTSTSPTGEHAIAVTLDANHAYLAQHRIDSVPVLPVAVALEMMAEAVRTLWRGWEVVEVRDCRLMKGVDMKQPARALSIVVNPAAYGNSEGFEVGASLSSEQGEGAKLIHYKATLRLEPRLPAPYRHVAKVHAERELTVARAYDEWLFHGPCFQVIDRIDGLSKAGAAALVHPTRPSQWLREVSPDNDHWVFDPGLVDAAAQMALLWARAFHDQASLPARFGRVVRYRDALPPRMRMAFEVLPAADASIIRANVHYLDADGEVVMLIEDMECIASAALNRLGGTARRAVAASV